MDTAVKPPFQRRAVQQPAYRHHHYDEHRFHGEQHYHTPDSLYECKHPKPSPIVSNGTAPNRIASSARPVPFTS